jgi:hypothetical protein
MMLNIQLRRAITAGPKSRVPFGIEGLLMVYFEPERSTISSGGIE